MVGKHFQMIPAYCYCVLLLINHRTHIVFFPNKVLKMPVRVKIAYKVDNILVFQDGFDTEFCYSN